MLIEKFTATAGSSKKLRITEEFANFLMVAPVMTDEIISIHIERAGKNIEIANRIPLKRIKNISSLIEGTSINDNSTFLVSPFLGGNFKSKETDAVIVEFHALQAGTYEVYGLQDFENANAILKYEVKSLLVGDRNKSFSLKGVQRIEIPTDITQDPQNPAIQFSEVGILYRDGNNTLVERRVTRKELFFMGHTASDINPYQGHNLDQAQIENLVLPVDGLEEIKFYHDAPVTHPYDILFQSISDIDGNLSGVSAVEIPNSQIASAPVYGFQKFTN